MKNLVHGEQNTVQWFNQINILKRKRQGYLWATDKQEYMKEKREKNWRLASKSVQISVSGEQLYQ